MIVVVPLRSDGQLTVKSLAQEANLRRNRLTHKHAGLKDLFCALVKSLAWSAADGSTSSRDR